MDTHSSSNRVNGQLAALIACAMLAGAYLYLGSQPVAVGAVPAPWDKLAHCALYGLLAALFLAGVPGAGPLVTVLAAAGLGAADEWHQTLLPGRVASVSDWAADVAAAAVISFSMTRRAARPRAGRLDIEEAGQ